MIFMIVFLTSLSLLLNLSISFADVEVFSGGQHFKSIDQYHHASKNLANKEAVISSSLSPEDQKKLESVSFNKPVYSLVSNLNFQSNTTALIEKLDSQDIQFAIREAVKNDKQPILLVSDSKKLKILKFTSN